MNFLSGLVHFLQKLVPLLKNPSLTNFDFYHPLSLSEMSFKLGFLSAIVSILAKVGPVV
jgi:hypothetical protein